MKFGTYFAYWVQEWKADYNYYCKKVSKLGFDVLEVGAGFLTEMSDTELEQLKKTAKEENIILTGGIGLPPQYDVSNEDAAVRQRGIEYVKKMFAAMDKADVRLVGGNIYSYWPVDYSKPIDKPAIWARSVESMLVLADAAADYGITIGIEVLNRFEQFLMNDCAEGVAYVKEVNKPNVKVMLDTFHMNIEEDSLGDAIREAGNYLGHFHIGETNRKVPGKGRIPWDEVGQALRDIKYDGAVVMEPFVREGGTVGEDIKVWRDLSGKASEEQLDAEIAESLQFVKKKFLP